MKGDGKTDIVPEKGHLIAGNPAKKLPAIIPINKEKSKMKIKKFEFQSIIFAVPVGVLVFMLLFGTPAIVNAKSSKKGDPFYEKARLIMTKEEKDIYKHLADKETKEEFIEEFWKKRDPTPETEENENMEEFHARIAFANRWFKESSKGRGWDTERGRLLLQLGIPNKREFGQATYTDRAGALTTSKRIPTEIWWYLRYQLTLVFQDSKNMGKYRLTRIPTNLLTSINMAQFSLDLRNKSNITRAFKFNVDYKKDKFLVQIPVKKLSFQEKDEKMRADFNITVYVYRNNRKVDELQLKKSYQWDKDEILNKKKIEFEIPYPVTEKGKYYFDVVIEERASSSKYRDFVKYKS